MIVATACTGVPQPQAAQAGLRAIFDDKLDVHRITLPATGSDGRAKWIMFEMWNAFVSIHPWIVLMSPAASVEAEHVLLPVPFHTHAPICT